MTYEADMAHEKKQLEHGGMIGGAISDHEYQVVSNGSRILRIKLRDLYFDFSEGSTYEN